MKQTTQGNLLFPIYSGYYCNGGQRGCGGSAPTQGFHPCTPYLTRVRNAIRKISRTPLYRSEMLRQYLQGSRKPLVFPSFLKMYWKGFIISGMGVLAIAYGSLCCYLFLRQREFIFNPRYNLVAFPDDPIFQMSFESVRIDVPGTGGQINGWWIPAVSKPLQPFPQEATRLKSPIVLLYFNGRGANKSYSLYRVQGFHGLGVSVLTPDYRGVGNSVGQFPSEASFYQDGQAAWNYLTQVRQIPPSQIVIYGESLGGAVAVDLAVKHPEAGAVILQSTFTSIASVVKQIPWFRILPVDWILTERFDSLAKVRSLKVPVLFLHGQIDDVIPVWMGQQLYKAAPEPKEIFLIPNGNHFTIYKPGQYSYLQVMQTFLNTHLQGERLSPPNRVK
jgi:uncharacterized protein